MVSDGINFTALASAQDHKRVFDRDKGPNTGGMGAYSPAPIVTRDTHKRIMDQVIEPLITGLAKEGKFYKGILYAGIMITKQGPQVLEFNVRFGDPETQAILPRLKTDLADLCFASIEDKIDRLKIRVGRKISCLRGFGLWRLPGDYQKGLEISGLEDADTLADGDSHIFHAGTAISPQSTVHSPQFITDGDAC